MDGRGHSPATISAGRIISSAVRIMTDYGIGAGPDACAARSVDVRLSVESGFFAPQRARKSFLRNSMKAQRRRHVPLARIIQKDWD
jgi:hypothetical protein